MISSLKFVSNFASVCCSSPLNTQVLFYDGHGRHFYDNSLNILLQRHIQYFIQEAGDSVNYQPNDNDPNMGINKWCSDSIMNFMSHHVTLRFIPPHMNSVLVETWESFKLSSTTITHKSFKKTHLLPLSLPDIGTNHQA